MLTEEDLTIMLATQFVFKSNVQTARIAGDKIPLFKENILLGKQRTRGGSPHIPRLTGNCYLFRNDVITQCLLTRISTSTEQGQT